MLSRKQFDILSDSLKWGFFSDDLIIVLSRFTKTRKYQEEGKEQLFRAKDFFADAIKGHNWIEESSSCSNQKSAYAFSQTVQVLSHIETSDKFVEYLNGLIKIIDSILNSRTVKDEDIERLIDFFTEYGKKQLQISEEIFDGETRYPLWQLNRA